MYKLEYFAIVFSMLFAGTSVGAIDCLQGFRTVRNGTKLDDTIQKTECSNSFYICHWIEISGAENCRTRK